MPSLRPATINILRAHADAALQGLETHSAGEPMPRARPPVFWLPPAAALVILTCQLSCAGWQSLISRASASQAIALHYHVLVLQASLLVGKAMLFFP